MQDPEYKPSLCTVHAKCADPFVQKGQQLNYVTLRIMDSGLSSFTDLKHYSNQKLRSHACVHKGMKKRNFRKTGRAATPSLSGIECLPNKPCPSLQGQLQCSLGVLQGSLQLLPQSSLHNLPCIAKLYSLNVSRGI